MQALRTLGGQVEQLFSDADRAVAGYASRTGLRCPAGCGACCRSPEIEVTMLDALPLALDLAARGDAESLAGRLRGQTAPGCPFFVDHGGGAGRCSVYGKRPLLCRLHGFAGLENKRGEAVLALCRIQKDGGVGADPLVKPPLFTEFSRRLMGIDPEYGTRLLPIHEAVRAALEKVLLAETLARFEESPCETLQVI